MARERRLGRKRGGGWWILNSAGELFQRGKMRLSCISASKKTTRGTGRKETFRLLKCQVILLICLFSRQWGGGGERKG